MKKILVSLSIIGVVAALAVGGTIAYFSNTETSTGNTFTAGTIDLQIDYQCGDVCYYPFKDLGAGDDFFDYCDLKPGDTGEVTISWHVTSNKAWGRLTMSNVEDWEYGCTDPEEEYPDSTCGNAGDGEGELSQYLTFTAWVDEGSLIGWQCGDDYDGCTVDPEEGNNIFDDGTFDEIIADGISIAQFVNNGINLPDKLDPNTTYYVGLQWDLPFSAPNIVQTDSLRASIVMEVVQSRNNPTPWQ